VKTAREPLVLLPFWFEEMTLGLMAPPISWLNWIELGALIGTDTCDCAFMRPVAGIEPEDRRLRLIQQDQGIFLLELRGS